MRPHPRRRGDALMPSLIAPVPILLDKPRALHFDMGALFAAERELAKLWGTKTNLYAVLADPARLTLNDIAVLVWCGVRPSDPALTLEHVQNAMLPEVIPGLLTAVYEAWNRATAPAEPVSASAEADADPFAPSPGASTGALP